MPGIQGRHFGAVWQYRQRHQGAMGRRPAISQQPCHAPHCSMMNGNTRRPHICSCTHRQAHGQKKKHYRHPLLLRSTRLSCVASHAHTHAQNQTHTIAQRQTHVLTVALHYSEPGVGGKGNKVVFISCSLGVL